MPPAIDRRAVLRGTADGLGPLLPHLAAARAAQNEAKQIVLIGGSTGHGLLVHDAQDTIPSIARYLQTLPEIRAMKRVTTAYPDGWPSDPGALDHAASE
jgi:hypothetical protein